MRRGDPWSEPLDRHPRARALIPEPLWSCVDEDAPFGSDEGADAYEEYRGWRACHPRAPLRECLAWLGDEAAYPDAFTFDATVLATVLGQLVLEGRIDADAKPAAIRAIERQLRGASPRRAELLRLARSAVAAG